MYITAINKPFSQINGSFSQLGGNDCNGVPFLRGNGLNTAFHNKYLILIYQLN